MYRSLQGLDICHFSVKVHGYVTNASACQYCLTEVEEIPIHHNTSNVNKPNAGRQSGTYFSLYGIQYDGCQDICFTGSTDETSDDELQKMALINSRNGELDLTEDEFDKIFSNYTEEGIAFPPDDDFLEKLVYSSATNRSKRSIDHDVRLLDTRDLPVGELEADSRAINMKTRQNNTIASNERRRNIASNDKTYSATNVKEYLGQLQAGLSYTAHETSDDKFKNAVARNSRNKANVADDEFERIFSYRHPNATPWKCKPPNKPINSFTNTKLSTVMHADGGCCKLNTQRMLSFGEHKVVESVKIGGMKGYTTKHAGKTTHGISVVLNPIQQNIQNAAGTFSASSGTARDWSQRRGFPYQNYDTSDDEFLNIVLDNVVKEADDTDDSEFNRIYYHYSSENNISFSEPIIGELAANSRTMNKKIKQNDTRASNARQQKIASNDELYSATSVGECDGENHAGFSDATHDSSDDEFQNAVARNSGDEPNVTDDEFERIFSYYHPNAFPRKCHTPNKPINSSCTNYTNPSTVTHPGDGFSKVNTKRQFSFGEHKVVRSIKRNVVKGYITDKVEKTADGTSVALNLIERKIHNASGLFSAACSTALDSGHCTPNQNDKISDDELLSIVSKNLGKEADDSDDEFDRIYHHYSSEDSTSCIERGASETNIFCTNPHKGTLKDCVSQKFGELDENYDIIEAISKNILS